MTNTLTGSNFIGFATTAEGNSSFKAFSPVANSYLKGDFHYATDEEMKQAMVLAEKAFPIYCGGL